MFAFLPALWAESVKGATDLVHFTKWLNTIYILIKSITEIQMKFLGLEPNPQSLKLVEQGTMSKGHGSNISGCRGFHLCLESLLLRTCGLMFGNSGSNATLSHLRFD